MGKCPKCGAPARHMPPDGDFKYDPNDIYGLKPKPRLTAYEQDLIRNIVIPMVSQRSRDGGDAWDQAAEVLRSIT